MDTIKRSQIVVADVQMRSKKLTARSKRKLAEVPQAKFAQHSKYKVPSR